MSHHGGGHAHGGHGAGKSHLPSWIKRLGVAAIICICVPPIVDGVLTGNVVGVILWAIIADLLSQFVWSWS